jgi:uncharacterized protein YrrD
MTTSRVQDINNVIGRAVLSVETANKLGIVHDLVIDPLKGQLVGISVHTLDQRQVLVSQREIESIGPDAVMLKSEQSLVSAHPSPVQALPLAKNHLIGVKVVSEGGRLLGEIANIYIHLAETSVFIYEVRSSIFDKLLGHALYLPASTTCAFSEDATRLIVSGDVEKADRTLEAVATRLFEHADTEAPEIIIRSRT